MIWRGVEENWLRFTHMVMHRSYYCLYVEKFQSAEYFFETYILKSIGKVKIFHIVFMDICGIIIRKKFTTSEFHLLS